LKVKQRRILKLIKKNNSEIEGILKKIVDINVNLKLKSSRMTKAFIHWAVSSKPYAVLLYSYWYFFSEDGWHCDTDL